MRALGRERARTAQAFQELFEPRDGPRDRWLQSYDPTDPQAEVMVYEDIEPGYVRTVTFETEDALKKWEHVLGDVERSAVGLGRGWFASRARARMI